MTTQTLRVGDLAQRTGLTVRTLHYWEEIGLLAPVQRTSSGQRAYHHEDIVRLQQIKSLRDLGFSIQEIRDCFEQDRLTPLEIIEKHLASVRQKIEIQRELCARLERIEAGLRNGHELDTEEFLNTIEAMIMKDKYYTPEQLEQLEKRAEAVGEERIAQSQTEWSELIAQVRAAMDEGVDPTSEAVLSMAKRWQNLVTEFTGGDPGITESLGTMYREQPQIGASFGLDPEIFAYIGRAQAELKNA